MLRVFNNTARYVDQGGGKRKGEHSLHSVHTLHSMTPKNTPGDCPPPQLKSALPPPLPLLRLHRCLPRALARRHHRVPGSEEESRKRDGESERSLLRNVDPRSLHEEGGAERDLVSDAIRSHDACSIATGPLSGPAQCNTSQGPKLLAACSPHHTPISFYISHHPISPHLTPATATAAAAAMSTRSLFCPNEAKGLPDVWGDEFEALYEKYEKEGKARKTMPAQDLWFSILTAQVETGEWTRASNKRTEG